MLTGHQFLKKEFDFTPRAAWLVDSFGHSAANARLYSEMGFEALFVARLDYRDRRKRFRNKDMNYIWRPHSKHFGAQH